MEESTEKITKFVATYSRVSTSKQEEDGTIETQLSALREYAEKNALRIVEEYVDEGWSGDILARPNLDRLRTDAKSENRAWTDILIYDPDRLARRYSYQELVMDELRDAGIEVMFMTISAPKNPEEKILHGVRGLFSEYERAKITERFRLGKLRSIKDGNILSSRPLYGYDRTLRVGKVPGKYIINEAEAGVVKMIFEWVANDGLTIRQVARRLQELAIPPKRSERGVWNTSTLTTMLRNEAYIGKAHWYSSTSVEPKRPINKEKYRKIKKSSTKKRPKSDWMYVPVPIIVDEELFNKARERLDANAALCKRNKKYDYMLGGRMDCVCGQKRIGAARQRGKYLYYDCCDKILCYPLPRNCHENPINARIADEAVWGKISSLMSSPQLLSSQLERWIKKQRTQISYSSIDISVVEKSVKKLKEQEERYNKGYGAGVFTLEQLKEYAVPIREKISIMETQISKARQEIKQNEMQELPTNEDIEIFAKKAQVTLENLNFEQKRAIVLNTVEKVVGSQKQLQVFGYIPLNYSYGGFKHENWYCRAPERRQVDAF